MRHLCLPFSIFLLIIGFYGTEYSIHQSWQFDGCQFFNMMYLHYEIEKPRNLMYALSHIFDMSKMCMNFKASCFLNQKKNINNNNNNNNYLRHLTTTLPKQLKSTERMNCEGFHVFLPSMGYQFIYDTCCLGRKINHTKRKYIIIKYLQLVMTDSFLINDPHQSQ